MVCDGSWGTGSAVTNRLCSTCSRPMGRQVTSKHQHHQQIRWHFTSSDQNDTPISFNRHSQIQTRRGANVSSSQQAMGQRGCVVETGSWTNVAALGAFSQNIIISKWNWYFYHCGTLMSKLCAWVLLCSKWLTKYCCNVPCSLSLCHFLSTLFFSQVMQKWHIPVYIEWQHVFNFTFVIRS